MPSDKTPRRFSPPWSVVSTPEGWRVDDATGIALAFVYGDNAPEGANDRNLTRSKLSVRCIGCRTPPIPPGKVAEEGGAKSAAGLDRSFLSMSLSFYSQLQ